MQVFINQTCFDVPEGATLQMALELSAVTPPYAVALNRQFVPRQRYAQQALQAQDRIDVVQPVTGG